MITTAQRVDSRVASRFKGLFFGIVALVCLQAFGITKAATGLQVIETEPTSGSKVSALTHVDVIFDRNVTGVDLADLLINGTAGTNMLFVSPREYVFYFPQPAAGNVFFSIPTESGIADLNDSTVVFGGTTWTNTLDLSTPPPQVVISEFLADNTAGIRDNEGNRNDWIELYNMGTDPVNLEGWFLTDTSTNLSKWRFPAVTLNGGSYMLVWASSRNLTNPPTPLHTNFKIGKDAGYLALLDAKTNVVSAFDPYPAQQRSNVSMGRDRLDPSLVGFYQTPTPGVANSTSGAGFAPDPVISIKGGVFPAQPLKISISAPFGQIRYSIDGSIPTNTTSLIYTNEITITNSAVVSARVFVPGLLPSKIVAEVFTLLGPSTVGWTSNLPVIVIDTGGRPMPTSSSGAARIRTFFSVFEPKDGITRLDQPAYEGAAQMEERGQTSADFAKKPWNLETDDIYGQEIDVSLLGLPPESDWALSNPFSDKVLMNNFLTFELYRKMGHYAPRCVFVEVFLKNKTRTLATNDYRGVYVLMEKIRIDKSRLDIEELSPSMTNEPAITGGYIVKKDKDSAGDLSFATSSGGGFSAQTLKFHQPNPKNINLPQRNWIRNYIISMEKALYATDWLTRTGTNHYSYYIDQDSCADLHWIVEFPKQIDGYRLSNYVSKDRGGKLKFEPIWDWNLAWGNADYLEGWITNTWYYPQISDNEHMWLRRMINGTTTAGSSANPTQLRGDPDLNQKIVDRWGVLRTNIMNVHILTNRINELADYLTPAAYRDFAIYRTWGTRVWPNPLIYSQPKTYEGIISNMTKWVADRYDWIDKQFIPAPTLNRGGGKITPGTQVSFSATTNKVLFTLNGADPRLPGGATNPAAMIWDGQPITITGNARIFARTASTNKNWNTHGWSAPAAATFVVSTPKLVVSEIMYHAANPPVGSPYAAEDFSYVELKNAGTSTLDLTGFRVTGGIDYTFTTTSGVKSLDPGARVLIVKNAAAFASKYPTAVNVAGEFTGNLGKNSSHIVVYGPVGEVVSEFTYHDSWYPTTDGNGFALVNANDSDVSANLNLASAWRPSGNLYGSPGTDDAAGASVPTIVVNEVLTNPTGAGLDAIELYNPTDAAVDIGGWYLTDDLDTPKKWVAPARTMIPAKGYLVLDESNFNVGASGFAFSMHGDQVYLFAANPAGPIGYAHGYKFGAAAPGVTFGRYVTSTGSDELVAQKQATLGSANAGPAIGPVVIGEVMFHPPDAFSMTTAMIDNNTVDEFIELRNITSQPVKLFDTNGVSWRVKGGADFDFPVNTTIPGNGFAVVVNFDPVAEPYKLATFRTKYAVNESVPVYGPYKGNLSNDGEKVGLYLPGAFDSEAGETSYVLVDEVDYEPIAHSSTDASGKGASIQRGTLNAFGNDMANWFVAAPSVGVGGTLRIGSVRTETGSIKIGFSAESGKAYTVWYRDSLGAGQWTQLQVVPGGAAREVEISDATSKPARFYQLSPQ